MNSDAKAETTDLPAVTGAVDQQLAPAGRVSASRWLIAGLIVLSALGLLSSAFLWQKLSSIQEHLARQSADAGVQSTEARTVAKQAQEMAREAAARVAVFDARLSEVALQRTQLEELMQSLSRSRDENLVVDIDSAIRLAQQQAQLTGSVEPLLAALKSADQRVSRAAQPRLTSLQRAIARDIDRIKSAAISDTPGLLVKLDELVHLTDELALMNAVPAVRAATVVKHGSTDAASSWWLRSLQVLREQTISLLRVSRIEQPEAALLSPEQSFFLRENLKLKLLNARLGLLARQLESARTDLAAATVSLTRYFDPASRKTQIMASMLQQVQMQMKTLQIPRVDETLAALATAAAGR
ncbi:MAG: uroporphyrinogen-III C-methyltransferase [Comamonadaceae bacterium]|jgi:uroporphyrin-III C-methyltransferase